MAIFLMAGLVSAHSSQAANDQKLQALLISGQMNRYHNADAMDRVLTAYLEETGLFEVTLIQTPPAGTDMSSFAAPFSDYDLLVLNYDGDDWPEPTQQAFAHYISGGGGLVSVHSSDNAFPQWQAFLEMTALGGWNGRDESWGPAVRWGDEGVEYFYGPGGAFHPPPHDYVITIRNPDHPITRGLPAEWLHANDELYSMLRGPARNLQVLATGFANSELDAASGQNEPVLMVIEYGQGRVFHTTLGHISADQAAAAEAVRCVGFATTFQRGAEWAASGEVTQSVPVNFPTAATKRLNDS